MAEARKIVEDWAAALDRADLDGSLDYVAPNVEFSNPIATTHGPAELRALFDVFWTALPDFKHEISQVLEQDDVVAIEGMATGTHTGPLASPTGEIPPTGRSVTFPFAAWARVENGKIVRFRGYWDVAGLMQQIAPAPEPAEAAV
jgi:steroid delta-isomerase-like uncharacterized protein